MSNEPHLTHCTLCGSDFAFCRCLAQRAEDLAAHLRAQAAGQASEIASLRAALDASRAGLRAALAAERKAHVRTTAERDSHRSAVTAPILAMLTAEQRDCYGVEPVVPGSHERDPAQLVTRLCDALSNVEQDRDAAIARAETAERERDEARAACAAMTPEALVESLRASIRISWVALAMPVGPAYEDAFREVASWAMAMTKAASDAGAPLLAELHALRVVREAAEALLVDFSRDDLVWESDRHRIARLRAALDAVKGGG